MESRAVVLALLATLVALVRCGSGADASLATECSADFQKVVGCLQFATGKAATPTKECCASVTEMRQNTPKCMCFIIEQSKNGSQQMKSLGIMTDKLLQLPAACQLKNTSVAECPKLLGLAPSSPEAAIFLNTTSSSVPTTSTPTSTKSDDTSGATSWFRAHFMVVGFTIFFIGFSAILSFQIS